MVMTTIAWFTTRFDVELYVFTVTLRLGAGVNLWEAKKYVTTEALVGYLTFSPLSPPPPFSHPPHPDLL